MKAAHTVLYMKKHTQTYASYPAMDISCMSVVYIDLEVEGVRYIYIFFYLKKRKKKRFVQKCVQDTSNSTRANTRTLPECASIKDKKLQNICKFELKSGTST